MDVPESNLVQHIRLCSFMAQAMIFALACIAR